MFKPPEAHLGDGVIWYMDGDTGSGGYAATVSSVDGVSVGLKLHRNSNNDELRSQVLHIDDPRLRENAHWREHGGWDFSSQTKKIKQLELQIKIHLQNHKSKSK